VEIARGLIDGYIDVACIFENAAIEAGIEELIVNECSDPLVWVRAERFVLKPGLPIPVLTWPGDDWTIRTLNKYGLSYRVAFIGPDYHAKLAAVESGIGFTVMPDSMVPAHLVKAKEDYLPALPPIKIMLCTRLGLQTERASALMKRLSALFFPRS
jgi:DNA-binding transcriptional LysR family regulator